MNIVMIIKAKKPMSLISRTLELHNLWNKQTLQENLIHTKSLLFYKGFFPAKSKPDRQTAIGA